MVTERLRIRPHHFYCLPTLKSFSDRSVQFRQVEEKIKRILTSESAAIVEIIQGVDELCLTCPNCVGDGCVSPLGDESEVRKWDAIILKELGLQYGQIFSVQEGWDLIQSHPALNLCHRCQWRHSCQRGEAILTYKGNLC